MVVRLCASIRQHVTLMRAGVCLLTGVVMAVAMIMWNLRGDTLVEAMVSTDNLAIVLAEQTSRSVQSVDIVLREVQEQIGALGVTTPEAFRSVLGTADMHEFLRSRSARLPQVDNIALVGADGIRVNYSVGWPVPQDDMSDREYTRHFQQQDDRGLFLNEPVVSRATRLRTLLLVRRVNGPRGEFLGMVLGSVPLRSFSDFYRSISLSRDESFMLLRRDGTVLMRHPDLHALIGTKLLMSSPWYAAVSQGGGQFETMVPFDQTRLVSAKPLRNYPLVMNVGLPKAMALAPWRRKAILVGLGTIGAVCSTLLLLRALHQQFDALTRQQLALSARNAELTRVSVALGASDAQLVATSRELETTLASMDQGLVMIDARDAVAVCNRRAIELLELPAGLMALRPPVESVSMLGFLAELLGTNGVADEYATRVVGDGKRPLVHERRLPEGRILEVRCTRLSDDGGWVVTIDDVTTRRRAEQQVVFMARHDVLTMLPNRVVFRERIELALAQADRAVTAAVMCLDLDYFKKVNDTLGHPIGDLLLRAVAERLSACVRQVDSVARFGGDEFAVIQAGPERAQDVAILAERIIEALSLPYEIDNHQVNISASIGIAMIPADGSDADTLLKNADIALYRAKASGRRVYRFFEREMDAVLQERHKLELDLRAALDNSEFELFYQPLVDLTSGRISGFEALTRWHHPTRGLVDAREFILLTEEMGLIAPLGQWALQQACWQATGWPADVRVSVNLSAAQFIHHDLLGCVTKALEDAELSANRLELEIAEISLLHHGDEITGVLDALRNLGVRITIDNFGAGYLSLRHLHGFSIDKIKIDRSFIRDLPSDKDAAAVVRAITTLGQSLGLITVAGGVERPDQLARLRDDGCTEAQGFLFGAPRPASEIPDMIRRYFPSEPQPA